MFRRLPHALFACAVGALAHGCGSPDRPAFDAGDLTLADASLPGFDSGRTDSGGPTPDAGPGPVDATRPVDAAGGRDSGTVGTGSPVSVQVDEFSTTSVNFVDVPGASLDLTADPNLWWIVLLSGRVCTDTLVSPSVEARLVIDAIEQGVGGVAVSPASHCGSLQQVAALPPGTSVHRVQVAVRNVAGENATLADMTLVAVAVDAAADVHQAENLPIQEVTSGSLQPVLTLTFTPAAAGEYLVLSVISAIEQSGDNIFVQNSDVNAGSDWPSPPFQVSRRTWQTLFSAERRVFDASEQTISLRARVGAASTGGVRGARIVALRTDAFEFIQSETTGSQSASGANDVLVTELTSAPPASISAQLVLQSMVSNVVCGLDAGHQPSFLVDSDVLAVPHSLNCGTRASYGRVSLIESASPISLENRLSAAEAGNSAIATNSVIHVLGLQ